MSPASQTTRLAPGVAPIARANSAKRAKSVTPLPAAITKPASVNGTLSGSCARRRASTIARAEGGGARRQAFDVREQPLAETRGEPAGKIAAIRRFREQDVAGRQALHDRGERFDAALGIVVAIARG